MREYWLQKYIKEYYLEIGFTRLYGPFKFGPDFKGVYAERPVKVEAEWDYSNYISHKHSLKFADVLVVAAPDPVPQRLKTKLPAIVINLKREQIVAWAEPRMIKKDEEDYISYTWRRLSRNLLYLYFHYRKQRHLGTDFIGYNLVPTMYNIQKPAGFKFSPGGKEISFEGTSEDKSLWDFWLDLAHDMADEFRLKPALLRPTWIDRLALYINHTGRITDNELLRFKDIALLIDAVLLAQE